MLPAAHDLLPATDSRSRASAPEVPPIPEVNCRDSNKTPKSRVEERDFINLTPARELGSLQHFEALSSREKITRVKALHKYGGYCGLQLLNKVC